MCRRKRCNVSPETTLVTRNASVFVTCQNLSEHEEFLKCFWGNSAPQAGVKHTSRDDPCDEDAGVLFLILVQTAVDEGQSKPS